MTTDPHKEEFKKDIIELLTELLKLASSGEVKGIAVSVVLGEDIVRNNFNALSCTERLGFGIASLQHEYFSTLKQEREY